MKNNPSAAHSDTTKQAERSPGQNKLGGLLAQLPATIRKASTIQKLVGGTLLALGVAYVARGKKKTSDNDQAATLDELLYFVNDRIAGYQRAVDESEDAHLRGYYKQLVSQSQQFATDLNTYLTRAGGEREESTTLKGKLYRAFMEAQAAVTGHSEKSLLAFNIHGETWALKAYKEALADQTLTGAMRQAVERQYHLSQQTFERLEKLEEEEA